MRTGDVMVVVVKEANASVVGRHWHRLRLLNTFIASGSFRHDADGLNSFASASQPQHSISSQRVPLRTQVISPEMEPATLSRRAKPLIFSSLRVTAGSIRSASVS